MKFAQTARPSRVQPTVTHEGAPAVIPPSHVELLLTCASTFLGEDTFYERADARRQRIVEGVHAATKTNPAAVAQIAADLRQVYQIRTTSIVVAAEYLAAGGPKPRAVLNSVLRRGDEPAELLAYWLAVHGKPVPKPLKRALADAVERLYTERNILKYDSSSRAVRMGDVVEMADPSRRQSPELQARLRYLLAERHHGDGMAHAEGLEMLRQHHMLNAIQPARRREVLREQGHVILGSAGFTWEHLSSWLPGGMDAEAWESIIPTMNVMALIRNLRNFDKVGISEEAIDRVIAKITDPAEVVASRAFPFRVYTAYREAPSDNWSRALGKTLEAAAGNMPDLPRTLVLIDVSGSMSAKLSAKGSVTLMEVASLMGAALARRSKSVDIGVFSEGSAILKVEPGASVLKLTQKLVECNGPRENGYGYHGAPFGHATLGHTAIKRLFDPARHDRVVMFTDDQMHDDAQLSAHVPQMITFGLGGYRPVTSWGNGRLVVSGFSEATFKAAAAVIS